MAPVRFAAFSCLVPVSVGGCYSYGQYALDRPAPGIVVEATLNDRGRLALEQSVGPEVFSVEGAVVDVTDSSFVMSIQRIVDIDRTSTRWRGELANFRLDYVRQLRERRFSTGRTVLLAGTLTAGAVAFAVGTSLVGAALGDQDRSRTPGDPANH